MNPSSPESFPGAMSSGHIPEAIPVSSEESGEKARSVESTPVHQESVKTVHAQAPIMPSLPAPQKDLVAHVQDNSGNPITAADDDVIEKEWVQKAKKIISETRDDPYTQEHEISKLQADYIKKRYGKEIKTVGES